MRGLYSPLISVLYLSHKKEKKEKTIGGFYFVDKI